MDFFKDEKGRLHGTRIAGVLYIFGLLPWVNGRLLNPMGISRIVSAAGWLLAFCDKRVPARWTDLLAARRVTGAILAVGSLAAQFYLVGK